jgi:YVTN family beta-propeller protein
MIYVTNSADNTIAIVDGYTNTILEDYIQVGTSPWGIAVNADTNMIYVTNYGDNSVSVINGRTHETVTKIPSINGPVDVAVNPVTNMIYVANYEDNSVSVINGTTNTKVGDDIQVGTSPGT